MFNMVCCADFCKLCRRTLHRFMDCRILLHEALLLMVLPAAPWRSWWSVVRIMRRACAAVYKNVWHRFTSSLQRKNYLFFNYQNCLDGLSWESVTEFKNFFLQNTTKETATQITPTATQFNFRVAETAMQNFDSKFIPASTLMIIISIFFIKLRMKIQLLHLRNVWHWQAHCMIYGYHWKAQTRDCVSIEG